MPLGAIQGAQRPPVPCAPSPAVSSGRGAPPSLAQPRQHQLRPQCQQRSVHLVEREPETQQEPVAVCLPPLVGAPMAAAGLRRAAALARQQPQLRPLHHRGGGPAQPTSLLQFREQSVFSLQVDEPPQRNQQKHQDYYANVGDAIRTLREDIPLLFVKDLNYEIYRDDIVFRDPNISFKGIKNYKLIFWSLRFHGALFFKPIYVEILRIWQPEDSLIKMRWKIHAFPRLGQAKGTFDAISTFKLDSDGKIYEHGIDNVQLRDPPITNPLLYGINLLVSPQGSAQQVPCPGSWFAPSPADGEAPLAAGHLE